MNKLTLLLIGIALLSSCDKDDTEVASDPIVNTPATIGDFREGGIVFYVDSNDNTHGLVCAVSDQSAGIQWYNGTYTATGATGTAVGTGKSNTTAIIASQGATETDYAAGLAKAYNGGGYNDWYLPSQEELNVLYANRVAIDSTANANGGSSFAINQLYWSSTEYDADSTQAIWKYFDVTGNGGGGFSDKNDTTYKVRAIRAF